MLNKLTNNIKKEKKEKEKEKPNNNNNKQRHSNSPSSLTSEISVKENNNKC